MIRPDAPNELEYPYFERVVSELDRWRVEYGRRAAGSLDLLWGPSSLTKHTINFLLFSCNYFRNPKVGHRRVSLAILYLVDGEASHLGTEVWPVANTRSLS